MPRMPAVLFLLVPCFLPAQSLGRFDSIVDFDTGLKELGRLLGEGRSQAVDTGKLYILTGTVSDVVPKTAWFFTLKPEEILEPASLATEVRRAATAFTLYLRKTLSPATAGLLAAYTPSTVPAAALIDALLKDLNTQIRSGGLVASGVAQSLRLPARLRALLALPTEDDEAGFLSRLLLEEGLGGAVKPVEVDVDLVTGEWIGTEDVRSYHALLRVSGPAAFDVFVRRRVPAPGSAAIVPGAKIMAVVSLLKPVELTGGTPAWLAECHRIRAVR